MRMSKGVWHRQRVRVNQPFRLYGESQDSWWHRMRYETPWGRWVHERLKCLGLWLMRQARHCLSISGGVCWVCGKACMGTVTREGMWCDQCFDRYEGYRKEGLIVDWRGLGRGEPIGGI